jgi:hypothetical protein
MRGFSSRYQRSLAQNHGARPSPTIAKAATSFPYVGAWGVGASGGRLSVVANGFTLAAGASHCRGIGKPMERKSMSRDSHDPSRTPCHPPFKGGVWRE